MKYTVDNLVEQERQEGEQEFNFVQNTNLHADNSIKEEFDKEQSFLDKTGDFFMKVLSIPEQLDKAVGIHGTRQKAIKALTFGLSEDHMVAALAGEMLVPDTLDIATLGLGYIPRRILTKGPKAVKMFLKAKKAKLPKTARKVADIAPAGSRFVDDTDVNKIIAKAQEDIKEEAIAAEKVLRAQGKLIPDATDISQELAESGTRQFISSAGSPNPMLPPLSGSNVTLQRSRNFLQQAGLMPFNEDAFRQFLSQYANMSSSTRGQVRRATSNKLQQGLFGGTRPRAFQASYDQAYASIASFFVDPANVGILGKLEDHHINAIMSSLQLYEGVQTFAEAEMITRRLMSRGVFTGNHNKNFRLLPEEVHRMVHRFIGDKMGYYFDGNGNVSDLARRVRNLPMADRLLEVDKFAKLVRESDEVTNAAFSQFLELKLARNAGLLRPQDWEDFYGAVSKVLDNPNTAPYITGQYQRVRAAAQQVMQEETFARTLRNRGVPVTVDIGINPMAPVPQNIQDALMKRDAALLKLQDEALNSRGFPFSDRAKNTFKKELAESQKIIDEYITAGSRYQAKRSRPVQTSITDPRFNPKVGKNYAATQKLRDQMKAGGAKGTKRIDPKK